MSNRTVVVHTTELFDVYIGRGSAWGNPWTHKDSSFKDVVRVATRREAVDNYRAWIQTQPALLACLPKLKGKVLGCPGCKTDRDPAREPCHGDVLAELADALETPGS